jgi:hypothetical protein
MVDGTYANAQYRPQAFPSDRRRALQSHCRCEVPGPVFSTLTVLVR